MKDEDVVVTVTRKQFKAAAGNLLRTHDDDQFRGMLAFAFAEMAHCLGLYKPSTQLSDTARALRPGHGE